MRQERETIHVSVKHKGLRTVLFILAAAIAVAALSIGFTNLGQKKPGFHAIEAEPSQEAPRYDAGITLVYDLQGSSSEIKAMNRAVKECYSQALLRSFQLLDSENEYEGLGNLAVLNGNVGKTITIAPELAAMLEDASARSGRGGFHLFAGPLYDLWDSILAQEDIAETDPALAEDLLELSRALKDPNCARVEILDPAAGTARLEVSSGFAALLAWQGYEGPVLDLNRMKDAYRLAFIRDALEKDGFTEGYLAADSGLTVTLSGGSRGNYPVYALSDEGPELGAAIAGGPATVCAQMRVFPLNEELLYGSAVKDGRKIQVHPNLSWTMGELPEVLENLTLVRRDGDVLACQEEALTLFAAESREALEAAMPKDADGVWALREDPGTLYSNAPDTAAAEEGKSLTCLPQ